MKPTRELQKKWILGALTMGVFVFLLSVLFQNKYTNVSQSANISDTNSGDQAKNYPKYYYFNKDFKRELNISAKAYLVGDLNTGEIILSKNGADAYPIASVSK